MCDVTCVAHDMMIGYACVTCMGCYMRCDAVFGCDARVIHAMWVRCDSNDMSACDVCVMCNVCDV